MRVISSNDLKRKLAAFQDYYNLHRMRRSLAAVRLLSGMVVRGGCLATLDRRGWHVHCRG